MKVKRYISQRVSFVTVLLIVITCVLNLVWPDAKQSVSENRSLNQFPEVSVEALGSSSFYKDVNGWFSDQFVGRDGWISLKYLISKFSGIKKIDDVFLGKGTLIQDTSSVNEEYKQKNIDAVNAFVSNYQGLNTYFLDSPNAVSVYEDRLPMFSQVKDQNAQIDDYYAKLNTTNVDVRQNMADHKDETLFYKSDHHWTSLGAYYAFEVLAEAMGLGEVSKDQYDIYTVANGFKGTLASRTGSVGISDSIDIYVDKNTPDYLVTYSSDNTTTPSIYNSKALETNDKYTVFMNGNSSHIRIECDNDSSRHLLLIKDSYANSMIQFLLPYFRTIDIVDPRYYYDSVESLIEPNLISDVLFLYNSNTLVQDTSLADCLAS